MVRSITVTPKNCDPSVKKAIQQLKQKLSHVSFFGFTPSRLLGTNTTQQLVSISNLATWIAGTTNRISVADDGDGSVTLSTPQDIHTGASPQFVGIELGHVTDTTFTRVSAGVVAIEGTNIAMANELLEDLITLGANAADGEFIVGTGAGTLTWESGNTARTSLGLGTGDAPTFAGLELTQNLSIGGYAYFNNGGALRFYNDTDNFHIGFTAPAGLSANKIWTLPTADGANGEVLQTNGSGALSWSAVSVAGNDTEIMFNDGGSMAGDANLIWNKTVPYLQVDGDVRIKSQNGLLLRDSDNSHYTRLKAHTTTTTSVTYTLPAADGSASDILSTNGSGALGWVSPTGTDVKVAIDVAATAGYLGAAYNDGVLRTIAGMQYTDGGDFVTIGPFTSHCRVFKGTAGQSIPASTWTKCILDDEQYDTDSEFDSATNYRFVAANAGYYAVKGVCSLNGLVAGKRITLGIRVNGSIVHDKTFAVGTTGNVRTDISVDLYLAATNYVEMWVHHTDTVARTTSYTYQQALCVHRFG